MPVSSHRARQRLLRWLVPAVLAVIALLLLLATQAIEGRLDSPYPIQRALAFDTDLFQLPVWVANSPGVIWNYEPPLELAFERGETLGSVLAGMGLESNAVRAIVDALARHIDVRKLRPEDRYTALVDDAGTVVGVQLTVVGKGTAEVRQQNDEWQGTWSEFVETSVIRVTRGVLQGSLEGSITRAGGDGLVAYLMAEVLQWDLDFNRDLQPGDRFAVVYEAVYLDGVFHRIGEIVALSYVNRGRQLEAYRFGDEGGYYDGEGRPLKKLFLKSPLRFSRVTSGFSPRRFHPVLKQVRPHYGVDYGAPVGTPVRVTGGGVVQAAGWESGGGKTVRVRHPNGYLTAYLHLSRFADGIRPGTRVRQGEVIGYVGATGLATGPHLDYRMQKNGRWINPQTFKSDPAPPIADDQLAAFAMVRDRLAQTLTDGEIVPEALPETTSQIAALESP